MGHNAKEIERQLADLGFILPEPAAPIANYVGAAAAARCCSSPGNCRWVPTGKLAPAHVGKVGAEVDEAEAAGRRRFPG